MRICSLCGRQYDVSVSFCPHDGSPLVVAESPVGLIVDGKFKIDAQLGEGVMGVVYRATQLNLQRPVALKVLLGSLLSDRRATERFRREALTIARLRHPNIVTILDFGVSREVGAYIVTELLVGRSLKDELQAKGRLQPEDAVRPILQVLAGLHAAHLASVVHRDLKPENIFLDATAEGTLVKILDFGIATVLDRDADLDMAVTTDDDLAGSPLYMSPEQCEGKRVDVPSDIYSLGCILYELLAGHPPFQARSVSDLYRMHITRTPDSLVGQTTDISPELEAVVLRALEKNPRDRFHSAAEFADAIEATFPFGDTAQLAAYHDAAPTIPLEPNSPKTPHNLPDPLLAFVAREDEQSAVGRWLSDQQVVTIIGPSGVGKTRLAFEVARQWLGIFPDGVWWVDLAPVKDANGLLRETASALAIKESTERSMEDLIAERVVPARMLIVLDNCGRVTASVADFVKKLVAQSSGLRILATCYKPLGISGERTFRLAPMDVPAADAPLRSVLDSASAQLFVERAQRVDPKFEVTPESAPALTSICGLLAGLPLTIELAAARAALLPLAAIAQRLEDRFTLLGHSEWEDEAPSNTLQATLDWSFSLLSREERMLFSRVAVFSGGFTLDAAERVCAGSGLDELDVLDLIGRLVNRSLLLVNRDAERYRMLETVRGFALERLESSGDHLRTHALHRGWALWMIEDTIGQLNGPDADSAIRRLDAERYNLRAALVWSTEVSGDVEATLRLGAAAGRYYFARGVWTEGRAVLEDLVVRYGDIVSEPNAGIFYSAGVIAERQGDYDRGIELCERSLAIRKALGDESGAADVLHILGNIERDRGDLPRAVELIEAALSTFRTCADARRIALALGDLGSAWFELGNFERTEDCFDEALNLARELGDRKQVASVISQVGELELRRGAEAQAEVRFLESLNVAQAAGFAPEEAAALLGLGVAEWKLGRREQGWTHLRAALDVYLELDELLGQITTLERMAECLAASDARRAAVLLAAATSGYVAIRSTRSASAEKQIAAVIGLIQASLDIETYQGALRQGSSFTMTDVAKFASTILESRL